MATGCCLPAIAAMVQGDRLTSAGWPLSEHRERIVWCDSSTQMGMTGSIWPGAGCRQPCSQQLRPSGRDLAAFGAV